MNSTRSPGSVDSIFCRSSLVTSSLGRRPLSRSLTAKSPVFGSVTPASPSCGPVRREKLSTSGVSFKRRST